MGPHVTGLVKDRVGKPQDARRRPAGRILRAAVPQSHREASELHSRLRIRRQRRQPMFPGQRARRRRALARATRRRCATTPARSSTWAASAKCSPRYENHVDLDPAREGQVGHSGPASSITSSATTKRRCARTWRTPPRRCSRGRLRDRRRESHGADRGLVDSRARHGADGHRSEDVGAESVSAVARREEPVRRRWQQPRERVVPEPDLDDHGSGVAIVRLPGRPSSERGICDGDSNETDLGTARSDQARSGGDGCGVAGRRRSVAAQRVGRTIGADVLHARTSSRWSTS